MKYYLNVSAYLFLARSLHYLFKGAKFIASNGLDSYYVKKGGSAKALEDFKSLNLNPKRRTIEGTEYLVGDIGNKMRVILSRDPFRKKYILTLGRPVRREVNSNIRTGYDEMGEKNIIYED